MGTFYLKMASNIIAKKFYSDLEEAWTKNTIQSFYVKNAVKYDDCVESYNWKYINDYCSNLLKQYLLEDNSALHVKDINILDFGCGSGKTGLSLMESGFQNITGIDASSEMVEIAKSKNIYRELQVGTVTNTEHFDVGDSIFEALICVGCFSSVSYTHLTLPTICSV